MKNIRLALLNIRKNIRNEKELRTSFIITVIGMAINNVSFLILWYYFGKTVGVINGWKPMDIFGLYGFGTTGYGLVISIFAGITNIPTYIATGSLDKYLLTPKSILVKVSTSKLHTSAFGDFIFGLTCFIVYIIWAKLSLLQILVSIYLILIAAVIIYSFTLICMTVSFYLMDGDNVSHGMFGLFLSNTLYHGGAFTGILRFFFIFIVPSLLAGAVEVEIVKSLNILSIGTITLAAALWFIFSIIFFNKSLKRYESNSLFGFGN